MNDVQRWSAPQGRMIWSPTAAVVWQTVDRDDEETVITIDGYWINHAGDFVPIPPLELRTWADTLAGPSTYPVGAA